MSNKTKLGVSIDEYYQKRADYLLIIKNSVEEINKFYNFSYNKITVRNQKTRWGSCSSKGNLNFNYRICLLNKDLMDYIITHELCHLEQMNHSKNFWDLVQKKIPLYKEKRKSLKRYVFHDM